MPLVFPYLVFTQGWVYAVGHFKTYYPEFN